MTKQDLLTRLWLQTARLVVPRRGLHDGRTPCECDWCAVSGTLRVLDDQFGADLAREQQRVLEARRAAMDSASAGRAKA